jgi:integrase
MRKIKAVFKKGLTSFYSKKTGLAIKSPFDDYHKSIAPPITVYQPWAEKDRKEFIKWLDTLEPMAELILKMALFCGMRLIEIDRCKVSWIREGRVFIPANDIDFHAKNHQPRDIPLIFDPLAIRAKIPVNQNSIYLVPSKRTSFIASGKSKSKTDYHRLQLYFAEISKSMKSKFPKLFEGSQTFHLLRKEFISIALTHLGDVFKVAKLGGHSVEMVTNIYGGLTKPIELEKNMFG